MRAPTLAATASGLVLAATCCTAAFAQRPSAQPAASGIDGGAERTRPETPPPEASSTGLTGDWGGLRSELRERGVSIVAHYVAQGAYNARGGLRRRVTSANEAMLGATLDLERLVGLRGTTSRVTFTYRHGDDLGAKAGFPNLEPVQEIFGRGRIVRLTEAWIETRLGGDLTARAGRMPAGDFASFPCEFQSLALCGSQPGHTVSDYWLVWPVSQWGAWARYGSDRRAYVQAGAYQVTRANLDEDPFEVGSLTGATGALLPFEAAAFPSIGDAGLAGSYKVGGWYDTTDAPDVFLNESRQPLLLAGGVPLRRSGRYGGYVSFMQELIRLPHGAGQPTRGLSVFLNVVKADQATALYDFELAAGLLLRGPFGRRPADLAGLGFATTRVNPRTGRGQRLIDPAAEQGSERVIELFYSGEVHPGIRVQPGVQFLDDPGGLQDEPDVVAPTLKVSLQF